MKLNSISFSYEAKEIFTSFSLEIPEEGITALTGPSGCGKTTLLRLIAGLETPSAGTITSPFHYAFLFQENRLLPSRSAKDQVRLVLPSGADPMPYLAAVGLADDADTLAEEMSGGMQRRCALARCLAYGCAKSEAATVHIAHTATAHSTTTHSVTAHSVTAHSVTVHSAPVLFLLDEPFAGVDPAKAADIMSYLRLLNKPVIFTAHSTDIIRLADREIKLQGD